jgi:ribonucleoside-diphosphate reductase alpha chain
MKSLYYCRSTSIQRADKVSHKSDMDEMFKTPDDNKTSLDKKDQAEDKEKYEECLSCQ